MEALSYKNKGNVPFPNSSNSRMKLTQSHQSLRKNRYNYVSNSKQTQIPVSKNEN